MRVIRSVVLAMLASTIISVPSVSAQTGSPKLEIGTRQGDYYWVVETSPDAKLTMSAVGMALPTDLLEDLTGETLSATKAMIEFGGGVGIPVSRLRIDLGYRFGRLFDTGEETINWSRFQAGVGVGF